MYGMIGHYNYVGSTAAAVLPLCAVLALFEKNWKFRIFALVTAALSLMLLLGSTSRAGLIGTAAAVVLGAIFFRRLLLRYWKILLLSLGALLAAVLGLNFVLDNAILERVPMLLADIQTIFSDTSDFDYKDHIFIRGVENREDGVIIFLQDNCLQISVQNREFVFRDENGEEILYQENAEGALEAVDSVFSPLSFVPANVMNKGKVYTNLSLIYNGRRLMQFYYDDSQIYLVRKNTIEKTELLEPPVAGFLKGKELIGSMRGYIWSRTLPMLSEYLLLGAGPDCFIFEFPQDDVLGKLYAYNNGTIVVDKPHNLYLQIFVNEGGIALLAFLTICILYFWDCFRLYAGRKQNCMEFRPVAVALGVAGYLFAGLFNDSTVITAVLFWALFGVGVGMNRQYRRERENQ
ncbi:MAG: O-antigen ligase family protein [Oscillospiraceae bacterium]|nr:O-antigen ligase family protein [Oscillospiraceae bacterium]